MARWGAVVSVILLLASGAGAQTAPEPSVPLPPQPAPVERAPGPAMEPAAFAPLPQGSVLVYSTFQNKIVSVKGWRVTFADQKGNLGAWLGGFIPDNVKSPLEFDAKDFQSLWPLKVGNHVTLTTSRGPATWNWELTVTRTELVNAGMGKYKTYVVDGIEHPVITSGKPYVMLHRWWYAPELRAVLRYRSLQAGNNTGHYVNQPFQTELQGIQKPR